MSDKLEPSAEINIFFKSDGSIMHLEDGSGRVSIYNLPTLETPVKDDKYHDPKRYYQDPERYDRKGVY